jgi:type II secretory pathway pseudopilin PulG
VVVAIIGILSTMVYINYTGYQKRARDSKRISDVNQIAQAVRMYAQERGTYYITYNDNVENPFSTTLPRGTQVGIRDKDYSNYHHATGWMNIKNTNQQPYSPLGYYPSNFSIMDALVSWRYLQNQITDPLFGKKEVPVSQASPYDYMYFQSNISLYCTNLPCIYNLDADDTLFAVFASLESPRDLVSYGNNLYYDGRSSGKSCAEKNWAAHGMNYVYSSKTRSVACN